MNSKFASFDRTRLLVKPLDEREHLLHLDHWLNLEDAAPPYDIRNWRSSRGS